MPKKIRKKTTLPLQKNEGSPAIATNVNSETNDKLENPADSFEQELCWCIQQLEISLSNTKTASQKTEENATILKTLKSEKAPLVKKRMLMRKAFGDYRNTMADEKWKIEKETQNIKIAAAELPSNSLFLKKAQKVNKSKEGLEAQFLFNFPDQD